MINVQIQKPKKCNCKYSMFVSFPYDNEIVEVIRAFPFRYWHNKTREWELPLEELGTLTEELSDQEFQIETESYITLQATKNLEIPENFKFKTKPYQYQLDGINFGLQNRRWLLGDEMGLGKSKQAIDIAVLKKQELGYKHCMIICGVNGLKWNWKKEIETHSDEGSYILGQRGKNIGSNANKLEDVIKIPSISEYFIITNIETFRSSDITNELAALCREGDIGMVIFDECHKAKNPSSQQGKGIVKIQADTMIAMTGTPLMNTPLDLYIILKWLGYENHTFYSFRNHYAVMGGYGGYQIMGYKNLDQLQTQLNKIMLRRLKDDVLDLPQKTYIEEFVEMTPKQEQIYREITQDIRANIDSIKMVNNPLAELIRMRQATGYTGILSSKIQESAKLDRMEELVEEAVSNGKKAVIFSNWTQMTDVIRARLAKNYKGVVITGQTADAERQVNVNHFQNNPECKYIIGTIGAMGTGLTLTAGTVEIFLDEPWNRANKEQAVDRCYRIGQKNNITIYTLMCKDTIDERIHELVEKKGEMADAIIDGKVIADKRALLEFLIGD